MSLSDRLKKRVTIQRREVGQDEAGQEFDDWVNVRADGDGMVAAEVKDISGKEFIASTAEQATVTTRITIRYRPGIESSMRVLHGSDIYNILAVLGQDNRTLLLMCERGIK